MTLAILFSLKTMESPQNGVATHFQAIPLISMKTESQASSQNCRSIDADAWCKRDLRLYLHQNGNERQRCVTADELDQSAVAAQFRSESLGVLDEVSY